MTTPTFLAVDVEPCAASEDGVSLRFKRAGNLRTVREIVYESEEGLGGWWRVHALDERDHDGNAICAEVEDSSDGVVCLIVGGSHGLRLVHVESGMEVYEAYLSLARRTEMRG